MVKRSIVNLGETILNGIQMKEESEGRKVRQVVTLKIKHRFFHVFQGERGKKTAIENNVKDKSKVL